MMVSVRLKPLLAGLPFGVLAERDFRLLFIGRTISLFGTAFAPIALAFAVVRLTGSPADLGLVLSAYMLAHLVFLLAGGVWADRLPRHLVMVTSDLLSGAAQIAAAVVLLTGVAQTWHLVLLGALRGGASAFFMPASTGLVPQVVSSGRLAERISTGESSSDTSSALRGSCAGYGANVFGSNSAGVLYRTIRLPPFLT